MLFFKKIGLIQTPRPKDMLHSNKKFNREDNISTNDTLKEAEPRRSERVKRAKIYGPDFFMLLAKGTSEGIQSYAPICFNIEGDLETFEKTMKSQDAAFWKKTIQDEMDSIMRNKT